MYSWLTPFLRCLFRQLLGEQKSGQKLKGNNLELFQKLKYQRQRYWKKNFSFRSRKFDIWQGHDAGLCERPSVPILETIMALTATWSLTLEDPYPQVIALLCFLSEDDVSNLSGPFVS
jgi:hypothetical protein